MYLAGVLESVLKSLEYVEVRVSSTIHIPFGFIKDVWLGNPRTRDEGQVMGKSSNEMGDFPANQMFDYGG
jgi:hypothetical protein